MQTSQRVLWVRPSAVWWVRAGVLLSLVHLQADPHFIIVAVTESPEVLAVEGPICSVLSSLGACSVSTGFELQGSWELCMLIAVK